MNGGKAMHKHDFTPNIQNSRGMTAIVKRNRQVTTDKTQQIWVLLLVLASIPFTILPDHIVMKHVL